MIHFHFESFKPNKSSIVYESTNNNIYISFTLNNVNWENFHSIIFVGETKQELTAHIKCDHVSICYKITHLLLLSNVITKPTFIFYHFGKTLIEQHVKPITNKLTY